MWRAGDGGEPERGVMKVMKVLCSLLHAPSYPFALSSSKGSQFEERFDGLNANG
jgi:hypothetical protein